MVSNNQKTSTYQNMLVLQFFLITNTQFTTHTIHNCKRNLKTSHQLMQTSDFQVKVKHFNQKHILFSQTQTLASDDTQTCQTHRLFSCLENTSEINSKHFYKTAFGKQETFCKSMSVTVCSINRGVQIQ